MSWRVSRAFTLFVHSVHPNSVVGKFLQTFGVVRPFGMGNDHGHDHIVTFVSLDDGQIVTNQNAVYKVR